jgi:hypothetical protein
MKRRLIPAVLAALAILTQASAAWACPFCSAVSQTFSEEIATMDVAVIAKLVKVPEATEKPGDEIQKATFEIAHVLKGDGLVKTGTTFETLYFGDGKTGKSFLVMGIDPPKVMWSTPLPLTERGIKYLGQILKLPKNGPERLVFFQDYLEDEDEMLARDAYDEFARAPYTEVKGLKEHMDHAQIVAWIKNPEIPASRRRLYLVMLGIRGDENDLPMLEEFMRSTDRKAKSGLDALIACYLTLKGEAGLKLVDELFLANPKADYADTYAAIMAIRFHGSEGGVIGKEALVKSLHHMLDRPELADLVIPDLAKWEDWGVMDRLFELYKTANEKNSWVRVPVINYLRVCPLPESKALLKECEKIDPAAMKRANTFFPVTPAASTPPANKATKTETPAQPAAESGSRSALAMEGETLADAGAAPLPPEDDGDAIVTAVNEGAAPAAAALKKKPAPPANLWLVLGVPWAVGLVLAAAQWTVLRR